jgi:2,3-bisphosphoglycerate-dependent phosphoglycerate mutase
LYSAIPDITSQAKILFLFKYFLMSITRLTIVRHGETEWNVVMRLQGKRDSKLTPLGRMQAEHASKALRYRKFDVLISSDQGRAIETAKIINVYHQLELILSDKLRERNFGIMEGLTREEVAEKYPMVHDGYMKRKSNYQIPEGESLAQFYSRVSDELKRISGQWSEQNILIISHGGVLDCTMRMVFGISLDVRRNFSIYNASINTFTYSDGHWDLDEWGNTEHFRGTGAMDELS